MRWFFVLVAVTLGSCATAPLSDPAADAEGKAFMPRADRGALYVYRSAQIWGDGVAINLSLNGIVAATLVPDSWVRLDVAPGVHDLRCLSESVAGGRQSVAAGEIRFFSLAATLGGGGPRCALTPVDGATGRRNVLAGRRVLEAVP